MYMSENHNLPLPRRARVRTINRLAFISAFVSCIASFGVCREARAQQPQNKPMTPANVLRPAIDLQPSSELQRLVDAAAQSVLESRKAKGFTNDDLAITLIDLSGERKSYPQASFRGGVGVYPASVVKMFYLVAAHRQLQDGELQDTPELRRALKDMIVDSSNDATHYTLDALTGTSSGVELPAAEMPAWGYRRNRVNRFFAALGYRDINVNQKTYCEDVYGRDRIFRGAKGENRNRLTTDATARLLAEIATGRAVNPARSREMMELLKRDPYATSGTDADDQSRGFTGRALNGAHDNVTIAGARLWSKAGWTSTTRHDAAYIELPNGKRFVLVTYTTNASQDRDIIPLVARAVISHFAAAPDAAMEK